MRLVSYRTRDGASGPGVLIEDAIHPIDAPGMREYLTLAPDERALRHRERAPIPLREVTLQAPVVPARNVFCVGRNYLEHAAEGARAAGRELKIPTVPTFFTKAPTAIAAPGETLELQARLSHEYDFEAELAVVIGTRCRDVAPDAALDVVFGYTALNDVTARNLQREHGQWFKGKSLDATCPLGPWIVTADEIGDPQALEIAFRLNGVEKQRSNTARMIFPIATLIASLSDGLTLLPGDVIATGTPHGVGFARTPPEFLADGDRMEVEIERIGTLGNTVRIR